VLRDDTAGCGGMSRENMSPPVYVSDRLLELNGEAPTPAEAARFVACSVRGLARVRGGKVAPTKIRLKISSAKNGTASASTDASATADDSAVDVRTPRGLCVFEDGSFAVVHVKFRVPSLADSPYYESALGDIGPDSEYAESPEGATATASNKPRAGGGIKLRLTTQCKGASKHGGHTQSPECAETALSEAASSPADSRSSSSGGLLGAISSTISSLFPLHKIFSSATKSPASPAPPTPVPVASVGSLGASTSSSASAAHRSPGLQSATAHLPGRSTSGGGGGADAAPAAASRSAAGSFGSKFVPLPHPEYRVRPMHSTAAVSVGSSGGVSGYGSGLASAPGAWQPKELPQQRAIPAGAMRIGAEHARLGQGGHQSLSMPGVSVRNTGATGYAYPAQHSSGVSSSSGGLGSLMVHGTLSASARSPGTSMLSHVPSQSQQQQVPRAGLGYRVGYSATTATLPTSPGSHVTRIAAAAPVAGPPMTATARMQQQYQQHLQQQRQQQQQQQQQAARWDRGAAPYGASHGLGERVPSYGVGYPSVAAGPTSGSAWEGLPSATAAMLVSSSRLPANTPYSPRDR
jgi:hypothetical protein